MHFYWHLLCSTSGMANLPRYAIIDDSCVWHVTWQCHNKDWLLESDSAKKIYYNLLLKYFVGEKKPRCLWDGFLV